LEYHRPEVSGRPVSLALRPLALAGRAGLLGELHSRLSRPEGDGPGIVVLHGLGGTGKTSAAVEYAHQHLADLTVAWQFPAEEPTVLVAEFARLGALLGTSGLLDPRDPVASVHAVLAGNRSSPWLLVFDNAPDFETIRPFLPAAGNGQVLITSQSSAWPPGRGMEVPVLDAASAAAFLTARTGDLDEIAATGLADELEGLPLALEQAAAYIQATGWTLAGYLALFRKRRADLLARGDSAGHSGTVSTTLTTALAKMRQAAPAAAGLLSLLARLAPEPVPLALLLAPGDPVGQIGGQVAGVLGPLAGDPVALADAIAALRRYSLITLAGPGLVQVHRLVQAIILSQAPESTGHQWRRAAAALVEAAIPGDVTSPATWPTCEVLLPHALAVLAEESDAMGRAADYLGVSGIYPSARDLQQRIARARERILGPGHPDTLTAHEHLARWTGEAGDPAAARDQYAALLPACERILGPEHPHTLTVHASLAHWTGETGDRPAARDQYAALVPLREQVSGTDHPDTLTVRARLAHWTGRAGNHELARDLLGDLLPVRERVLGREHPDTLAARHSLARWTGEAGDPAAARDQYEALLPIRERILGPEHPDTLITQHSLARWTGIAGNAARARDLLNELLPIRERVSGPGHPDTLTVRWSLARWTGEAGDPAAARDQYEALLPIRERILGPEHPDTLITRDSLARWAERARTG
jgi:hypothetical protein